MNAKHAKTLRAVFTKPTLAGILFSDMEALLLALGAEMREGAGSRVVFEFRGKRWYPHRPHPGKEAKRKSVLGSIRSPMPAVLPLALRCASSPYFRYGSSARLVPSAIRLGLD